MSRVRIERKFKVLIYGREETVYVTVDYDKIAGEWLYTAYGLHTSITISNNMDDAIADTCERMATDRERLEAIIRGAE